MRQGESNAEDENQGEERPECGSENRTDTAMR